MLNKQKEFFKKGTTLKIDYRKETLKKLKKIIKKYEFEIIQALNKDLHKSELEAYVTEIGMVYKEIDFHIKYIKKWAKVKRIKSSLMYFPSKSYVYKEPCGNVLIIGPFNYPFHLVMLPLIGAISAGNTVIIKPSEYSVHTSKLIEKLINENFKEEYISVVGVNEGKEIVEELLDQKFNYIFFTGSIKVGRIVMEKASKLLIPVTLELGGKSPCIVDKDANLEKSAKRIVWGKLLNAGQTCVAPDYLFIHKDIKNEFLELIKKEICAQYGENTKLSEDYPKIINIRELNRLISYLENGEIYFGGNYDKDSLYFEPTILTNIKSNTKILDEEIFGPIFPIFEFENIDEIIEYINNREKPLALYYFSEDKNNIEKILKKTSSGGVTINDTIIQAATLYLPFGGVGSSGMGSYHGKASFDTFTHEKPVIKRQTYLEFPFRFAPFKDKIKIIKAIMK